MSDSSCSLFNNSDSEFNLWDVFICTCDIDTGTPWHVLVDHSLQWRKFSICMDSCDVEPTLHVITVYLFECLEYVLQFSVCKMVDSCESYLST